MDLTHIASLVHSLPDVSLAVLLSLAASSQFLLISPSLDLPRVADEVEHAAIHNFGLTTVTVHCSHDATLDEFVGELLRDGNKLPEALVLCGLDETRSEVQAMVLELIRTHRIVTSRFTVTAPEHFLVIPVVAEKPTIKRLPIWRHLLEHFFISHDHTLPLSTSDSETSSLASVVIRKHASTPLGEPPFFLVATSVSRDIIDALRALVSSVELSTEVRRYLLDISVFLRMHRAVRAGSISAQSTRDFELLVRCLAPLHGLDFVTPALVTLGVWKVYKHRMEIVGRAEDERSMVYGSDRGLVEEYLKGVDADTVIEEVLDRVRAPW